ncbi:MAG: ATP-binding protein [Patescibacteria group bacterium]
MAKSKDSKPPKATSKIKADESDQDNLGQQRLSALVNSMADAVVAVDEEGKIVIYNGATLDLFDVNIDLTGKKVSQVAKFIAKNGQKVNMDDQILKTKTQHTNRDLRLVYSDGSEVNVYISIAPVRLGYGEKGKGGFVVLMRDITREKSLEEERDEFISVVSHELRTPVAITEGNISNAILVAENKSVDPKIIQMLDAAHDQAIFLSKMINDLSTLSRAERGALNVEVTPINMFNLVNKLAKEYSDEAKQKGLKIITELDPKLRLLPSSELYVREVIQNFVTNAIKYTEKGHITIKVTQAEDSVLVDVIDTGIGISNQDQEKVFEKFFRSEDYRTRVNSGTGLGLYVTMKLAKILKAKISLESKLNHGSKFSIVFPNLG